VAILFEPDIYLLGPIVVGARMTNKDVRHGSLRR
jgi:hypothetical protein